MTDPKTPLERRPKIDGWLDERRKYHLTDDQRAAAYRAFDRVDARFPDGGEDVANARDGAFAVLISPKKDDAVDSIVWSWKHYREMEKQTRMRLTGAIIAATILGDSENGLATRTGVSRPTIRKALGKKG